MTSASEVLDFWFGDVTDQTPLSGEDPRVKRWFAKDDAFDAEVRERFGQTVEAALNGELDEWRREAESALALVIVLDQFPRNLFRDSGKAFAGDPIARPLVRGEIEAGRDQTHDLLRRQFLYLPLMHSEHPADHTLARRLYTDLALEAKTRAPHNAEYFEYVLVFEMRHAEIIERFGRYPHRNAALGRESTPSETAFLKEPGSSF